MPPQSVPENATALDFWARVCTSTSVGLIKNHRILTKSTTKWKTRLRASLDRRLGLARRVRSDLVNWYHHEVRYRGLSEPRSLRVSRMLSDFDHLICLVESQLDR